jgi:O-acetyl-ADP-ribose deacetylase (regulator of RNase III)
MIELIQGDITKLEVDAIVNAANRSLLGGGGVDGAIHRAAGPELLKECRSLNGCETGEAKITSAYQLPAKFVIHTAGPVWSGGNNPDDQLLERCYLNCLKIADEKNLSSIAFPNISTGAYCFPKDRAAKIAVNTVKKFLSENNSSLQVIFVCFDDENYFSYQEILSH